MKSKILFFCVLLLLGCSNPRKIGQTEIVFHRNTDIYSFEDFTFFLSKDKKELQINANGFKLEPSLLVYLSRVCQNYKLTMFKQEGTYLFDNKIIFKSNEQFEWHLIMLLCRTIKDYHERGFRELG